MLSQESIARIEASNRWRTDRVEALDLPDGRVIVKGQRKPRGRLRFALLSLLACLTRNPLLKAVPAPGGAVAQATEIRRLRALGDAGVRVPQVIHVGKNYFVMTRIEGNQLGAQFSASSLDGVEAVGRGLKAIGQLHAQGQYLSQAFARNILDWEDQLWFVDFEDDPLEVMDLHDAQARDLLAFILSVFWSAKPQTDQLMAVWCKAIERMSPAVIARVRQASSGLLWLRYLPSQRRPWGRDVVTVQAMASFLKLWNLQELGAD